MSRKSHWRDAFLAKPNQREKGGKRFIGRKKYRRKSSPPTPAHPPPTLNTDRNPPRTAHTPNPKTPTHPTFEERKSPTAKPERTGGTISRFKRHLMRMGEVIIQKSKVGKGTLKTEKRSSYVRPDNRTTELNGVVVEKSPLKDRNEKKLTRGLTGRCCVAEERKDQTFPGPAESENRTEGFALAYGWKQKSNDQRIRDGFKRQIDSG